MSTIPRRTADILAEIEKTPHGSDRRTDLVIESLSAARYELGRVSEIRAARERTRRQDLAASLWTKLKYRFVEPETNGRHALA